MPTLTARSFGGGLFVFVWFSDDRWFGVFIPFSVIVLLVLLVGIIVGSRGGIEFPTTYETGLVAPGETVALLPMSALTGARFIDVAVC